jgi:hypothetical protein
MHHRALHTLLGACKLALLFSCATTHAEIYKWVDEQGRTHYSHNKADAERAKGAPVPIRKQAPAKAEPPSYWDYVTDKNKQKQRTETSAAETEEPPDPADTPATAKKRYEGTDDAARCEYALDILNGKLRLISGIPIDSHDRKLAAADVARFCR